MKPVTEFEDGFVCIIDRMSQIAPYVAECGDLKFVIEYTGSVLKVRMAK